MPKYMKRDVTIEALQWAGPARRRHDDDDPHNPWPGWFTKEVKQWGGKIDPCNGVVFLNTPDGRRQVNENDYIICDSLGRFSMCEPDIFEETYELIEE